MSFTARQAQAGLEESQRASFQTLTRIAEQHGAALGAQTAAVAAQKTELAGLREQFRRQGAPIRSELSRASEQQQRQRAGRRAPRQSTGSCVIFPCGM